MVDDVLLIVNADDFGLSDGVNRGVVDAHQRGIVSSASLMVRAPAAEGAAALAKANPELGLGLHLDIGEWMLVDGRWEARYQRVVPGDATGAEAELHSQVLLFESLTGRTPDHIDSHQHVHLTRPEVAEAVHRVAGELGVGVRSWTPRVAYRGLYGQDRGGRSIPEAITPDAYVAAIRALGPGVTEFACHPGYADGLDSAYRDEREVELRTLCDPAVRACIKECGVRVIAWSDVGG